MDKTLIWYLLFLKNLMSWQEFCNKVELGRAPTHRVRAPFWYSWNAISNLYSSMVWSNRTLWHPLKGPCQEKTLLHRKKDLFFAGTSSSTRSVPCRWLHPGFQNLLVRILTRSATRHPSGSRPVKEKIKIDGCEAKRSSLSRSGATILFLCGPWSEKRTPEKHRYLVMSNGFWQNIGLKKVQP